MSRRCFKTNHGRFIAKQWPTLRAMASAQDTYLLSYHQRWPGQSPAHFGRGITEEGGSSYDAIASRAEGASRVLDLGCGDGHLLTLMRGADTRVGVDMCHAELAMAACKPELRDVLLVQGIGQGLPFANASFDLVVSHMAFMLMSNMEEVAREIGRVLLPGGRFITAVGGGPLGNEAFAAFAERLHALPREANEIAPPIGDKRARSGAGMRELFRPETGFSKVRADPLTLRLDGSVDMTWESLAAMYGIELLSAANRNLLEVQFRADAAALADDNGIVRYAQWMRLFTALRT